MLTSFDRPPSSDPESLFGKGGACPVLTEIMTPRLYQVNPFRLLGLPVLAGARETARRVEQLKMAAELGMDSADWAFAPAQAPDPEKVRSAAQLLKEPAVRLAYELFWFWPENYPDETSTDEALGLLAAGDAKGALALWERAAAEGKTAAVHNIAVVYHLRALDLEQQNTPPEDELIQLWFKSLRAWEKAGSDEELWSRLRGRVARVSDARVTTQFVEKMEKALPDGLARLSAALAVQHGGESRHDRAALHAALVTHIHSDSSGARRALEAYAAPIARRIDTRLVEARKRVVTSPATALVDATALLASCREDLRIIELLCGRGSDYHVEVSQAVADVAVDLVVAHQRETRDDRGCLPLLVHLLDFEAMPELKDRLAETFGAVYRNALNIAASQPKPVEPSSEGPAAIDPEQGRALALLSDAIVPGWKSLGLHGTSRSQYAARVAGMLKDLGVSACLEREDLNTALQAFALALQLPVSLELRESLESDRAQLQMDYQTRREKELRVECGAHSLVINGQGICLDERWVAPSELAALRYGAVHADAGALQHLIGWRSAGGEEFEINAGNLLPDSPYALEHYNRMVDSIYFFLVPALIDRLVAAIRAGERPRLGERVLEPEGIVLGSAEHFWQREQTVPYARVETVVEAGRVIVSSRDNPRLSETYDVATTWNASVFRYVVEALTQE